MAARYARLGLEVELQVRYHPLDRDDGDIAKWLRYVRSVVRAFGPNRAVTGLQITNEVNISYSKNTSDGFYKRAVEALVRGVIEAKRTSREAGLPPPADRLQLRLPLLRRRGTPTTPRSGAPWDGAAARGCGGPPTGSASTSTPAPSRPGSSCQVPIVDFGDSFLEGLAQVRECYMPMAGLQALHAAAHRGDRLPHRPRPLARPPSCRATREFVRTAVAYRGTYGISDFRWFGLRDNNSEGPNFQSFFGLLARRLLAEAGLRRVPPADRAVRALGARRPGADHPRGRRRAHAVGALELGERVAEARPRSRGRTASPSVSRQADQLARRAERGHELHRAVQVVRRS